MSSSRVVEEMSSRLASLIFAPGAVTNFLENSPHSVLNPYYVDFYQQDLIGQSPTSFNQQVLKFEMQKYLDCFRTGYFKLITNAATFTVPQTTEAFVNYTGFKLFPRIQIQLTNNDYTGNFVLPYFMYSRQNLIQFARQYLEHQEDTMMIGKSAAFRQAALASGWTFIVDLEVGQSLRGFENMFWISPLANQLTICATLANANEVIFAPGGLNTNISNINTLINSVTFVAEGFTVDDDARANVIATYNTDDGVYNFLRESRTYTQTYAPTAASGGQITMQFNETRPVSMFSIYYECVDKVDTPWQMSPFDIQGPTMTDTAGNTVNFPTHFQFNAGEEVIIKKRPIDVQRTWVHRKCWPDQEAGPWILHIPVGAWDPLKDNSITGAYDPNVWANMTLILFFSGAVASGGSGAKVTMLTWVGQWVHTSHADGAKVLS
jgi:hypothetical protein